MKSSNIQSIEISTNYRLKDELEMVDARPGGKVEAKIKRLAKQRRHRADRRISKNIHNFIVEEAELNEPLDQQWINDIEAPELQKPVLMNTCFDTQEVVS